MGAGDLKDFERVLQIASMHDAHSGLIGIGKCEPGLGKTHEPLVGMPLDVGYPS